MTTPCCIKLSLNVLRNSGICLLAIDFDINVDITGVLFAIDSYFLVEAMRVGCIQGPSRDISVKIQVGTRARWCEDPQGIRAYPAFKHGSVIPLPEVFQPNLDVVFLAREAIVLAKPLPS